MCLISFLNCLITLTVLNSINGQVDDNLIVELSHGKLQGKDRGFYYSYESIPYAKAPVGELRFESPQPYDDKWHDIFDATKAPVACLQWNQLKNGENKLQGFEDCLFVNIYKPKTGKEKYPVVVFIHGGAFMFGAANIYGEDILMKSGEIMFVTISYRLGPLGFLSTHDEIISGNYGLKDQQLALKWIKNTIQCFNGDPEKILLMGFSSGGASAHLHMLNPYADNMVKAVFTVSGVALNPWVIMNKPKEKALRLAQILECPDTTNTNAIKHCLKQKPADDIVTSVREFLNWGYNPVVTFGPVVEHKSSPQAFMTEHPRDIIKTGNYLPVPWLASYTTEDGAYNAAPLMEINPRTEEPYINNFKEKWLELAPQNLFLDNLSKDPVNYAQELLDHYMGNLTFSEENYLKLQKLYTDVIYRYGLEEVVKLHGIHRKAAVYAYVYANPSDFSLANILAKRNDIKFGNNDLKEKLLLHCFEMKQLFLGTAHGDDLSLMLSFPGRSFRSDEEVVSQNLIKMLEDFVKEGYVYQQKMLY